MFRYQGLTSNVLPGLAWWAPEEVEQTRHLDSVSGLNCPVTSPQPPHPTSTTTLLPRLLLLLPLLFSFSQDTAGDQILLVSVSASGDQMPEWGEEEESRTG